MSQTNFIYFNSKVVRLNGNALYLQPSTSCIGFINALHVQVASIGTVPIRFVLFLFDLKSACLRQFKRIVHVIHYSLSIVVVNIVKFFKFFFQRSQVTAFG